LTATARGSGSPTWVRRRGSHAVAAASLLLLGICGVASAAETDQYLSWGVVLSDSAEPFNAFLNQEAQVFLNRVNERTKPLESPEQLTIEFYQYLFQGLHSSRVRAWANHAPEVDRFPDRGVSFFAYQRMSIYRDLTAFPFVLPMTRTVRVGNIYFGTDKIGHFFGFGRRYFQRYLLCRRDGLDTEKAMRKVVLWGVAIESSFVGGLVDGIFSHADLEANFQGFLMARSCCEGDDAHFRQEGGQWRLARPFDMRDYITPDFDESYNNSHYTGLRKDRVLEILRREYCPLWRTPEVQARTANYAAYAPSFSKRVITEHFDARRENPQRQQSLAAICDERTEEPVGTTQP